MFKDKHFEVKVKKDENPIPPPQPRYIFTTKDVEDAVISVTVGVVVVKTINTLLRMAEHVVVTKVK